MHTLRTKGRHWVCWVSHQSLHHHHKLIFKLKKKKKSGKKNQTFELRSFYLPLRVGQTLVHWIVYRGQMPKAERSSWQEEHRFCDWNTHKTSYKEEHCRILNKFAPMRKKKSSFSTIRNAMYANPAVLGVWKLHR